MSVKGLVALALVLYGQKRDSPCNDRLTGPEPAEPPCDLPGGTSNLGIVRPSPAIRNESPL